jgi:O-antigen ligase
MPPAGFEPTIPATERLQTHAIRIGNNFWFNSPNLMKEKCIIFGGIPKSQSSIPRYLSNFTPLYLINFRCEFLYWLIYEIWFNLHGPKVVHN